MKNIGFILMICMMSFIQVACDNEEPGQMSVTSDMFLQITNYGAQNETYIEGWEKKASNLLIYKRLCKI